MKLTMLGTGNAGVINCFNTCFVLEERGDYFLVDTGGGNGLMKQLKSAGIPALSIRHIFITHRHLDHITGMLWMLRSNLAAMKKGRFTETLFVYGHDEVIRAVKHMAEDLFPTDTGLIKEWICFREVKDGESVTLLKHPVTFFDNHSNKAKQFGFCMETDEGKIVCCGDEPLSEYNESYAENALWLLHEAFCLYRDAAIFKPYEKSHSTVKDACENAERLHVQNLLLYHTEESDLQNRKENYTREGKEYYHGNLVVPDDLESIFLY